MNTEYAWGNTAASVGEYEEARGPRTLDAAEKKTLANLYGFNRIKAYLCGFAHQTDPNRK